MYAAAALPLLVQAEAAAISDVPTEVVQQYNTLKQVGRAARHWGSPPPACWRGKAPEAGAEQPGGTGTCVRSRHSRQSAMGVQPGSMHWSCRLCACTAAPALIGPKAAGRAWQAVACRPPARPCCMNRSKRRRWSGRYWRRCCTPTAACTSSSPGASCACGKVRRGRGVRVLPFLVLMAGLGLSLRKHGLLLARGPARVVPIPLRGAAAGPWPCCCSLALMTWPPGSRTLRGCVCPGQWLYLSVYCLKWEP